MEGAGEEATPVWIAVHAPFVVVPVASVVLPLASVAFPDVPAPDAPSPAVLVGAVGGPFWPPHVAS